MNPVELHLALNHLPVVGALLMVVLLTWGLVRRSKEMLRAALWITLFLAAGSYVAVATGEKAEEYVEDAAWFDEGVVHDHEELGELALKVMLATGVLVLIGLWGLRGDGDPKRLWPTAALVALIVSTGLLGWAAATGGQIRHVEIRPGAPPPGAMDAAAMPAAAPDDESADEHEDSD